MEAEQKREGYARRNVVHSERARNVQRGRGRMSDTRKSDNHLRIDETPRRA
jgi:hypothetical protein